MNHQWPPEVTRAMHQFSDAAPAAPSLTSVFEHRPIPPSSRPRRRSSRTRTAPRSSEGDLRVPRLTPTSETRNRRRLAMAAAAVVAVIGVAAIAINSMNSDDDQ